MRQFLISPEDARNFEALKAVLQEADRSTVAFVGSGLSRSNGYVSWEALVDRLAESANITVQGHEVDELLAASEEVWESLGTADTGDAQFRAGMRRSLLETDHQLFHSSHQRLVVANFSAFLTTNFDPSIGIAAKSDPNRAFKTISYQPDRPFDPGYLQSGGIYHLHGRLWDEGMNSVNDPIVFL